MKRIYYLSIALTITIVCTFSVNGQNYWTLTGNDIYNSNSGNVGIGTNSPSKLLHVSKNMTGPVICIQNEGGAGGAAYKMVDDASGADWLFKATQYGGFKVRDQAFGLDVMTFEQNASANSIYVVAGGGVGIGTTNVPSGYKFAVDGNVIVEELSVQLSGSWPDYVFEENYPLRSLGDLERFINQHGHLPDVPPASELENGNMKLGEMNTILMRKVEELTLYVIDLKKEIEELKSKQ